jgi:hypothetical protein
MEKEKATSSEKKAALETIRAEFKGNDTKTQCARLLEALGRFPVTTFEAMRFLDVYHCPARVMQLRKAGHRIITHRQTVLTEAGVNHCVGLYALDSGASHEAAA